MMTLAKKTNPPLQKKTVYTEELSLWLSRMVAAMAVCVFSLSSWEQESDGEEMNGAL